MIVAATAVALAARTERYAPYVADARAALTLDSPFCGPRQAMAGLATARQVSRRTAEILKASRFLREDQDGLYLYATPAGEFWMPQATDLWSLAVVLAEQEQQVYGTAGGFGIRPGDVVIDAGAHVGLFARTALAAGASKVIAFEVSPQSNLAMKRNFAEAIAAGRLIVVEKGVWHQAATLPLQVVDGCSACNSVSHPWMGSVMEVPLVTIDQAMIDLGITRVDFIKLDVENAEANALRGALDVLERDRPRVAVALENSKTRIAYGHEVLGLLKQASLDYTFTCGAVTDPAASKVLLPEILHFYPD